MPVLFRIVAVTSRAMAVCIASLAIAASALEAQEPGGPHLEIPEVLTSGESGPTLLLIPCAACGAASWQRFMDVNADRFRMIAVTLPGYDGSPRPELPLWTDSSVFQDNAVAQLARLLDERSLQNVVIVGQSFGSTIAVRLAAARPERIAMVVNVDGSPYNPLTRAAESIAQRLAQARSIVDEDWARRLRSPAAFRQFNAAGGVPGEEQRRLHHGMFMASDRVSMLHYWRENLLIDVNPDFRRLRMPFLDIKAISPRIQRPDSAREAWISFVDSVGTPADYTRVAFFDTSHWIHVQRPRELGSLILGHIENRPVHDVGPFVFGDVVRAGTGARDVILMPCLGCDARSWNEFMERNSERYRMFAITWPGMGSTGLPLVPSDPGGTPYFDFLMEALRLLIQRDSLVRPVIVGHSAAAVAAVRFATEHPDLVSGVVNVDAVVANLDTHGFTPEQRRAWADAEMQKVLERHDDDEAWRRLNAAPRGMRPERAGFYEKMWLAPPRQNVFAYWRDWLRTDAGRHLPRLTVPFLAVHALPADTAAAAAKRADTIERYRRAPMPPGARTVFVENSGHTIWEHQPALFDRILASFILGSEVASTSSF